MDSPTFRSLEHCLAVAYLMEIATAYPKGNLGKILDELIRTKYGIETEAKEGPNWGRIQPLEIRGTCVMIRQACKRLLFPIEYALVLAKFSNVPEERDKAINVLANHVVSELNLKEIPIIEAMVKNVWCREKEGINKIAKRYHMGNDTVGEGCKHIHLLLLEAWKEAAEELHVVFRPEGLY